MVHRHVGEDRFEADPSTDFRPEIETQGHNETTTSKLRKDEQDVVGQLGIFPTREQRRREAEDGDYAPGVRFFDDAVVIAAECRPEEPAGWNLFDAEARVVVGRRAQRVVVVADVFRLERTDRDRSSIWKRVRQRKEVQLWRSPPQGDFVAVVSAQSVGVLDYLVDG